MLAVTRRLTVASNTDGNRPQIPESGGAPLGSDEPRTPESRLVRSIADDGLSATILVLPEQAE